MLLKAEPGSPFLNPAFRFFIFDVHENGN